METEWSSSRLVWHQNTISWPNHEAFPVREIAENPIPVVLNVNARQGQRAASLRVLWASYCLLNPDHPNPLRVLLKLVRRRESRNVTRSGEAYASLALHFRRRVPCLPKQSRAHFLSSESFLLTTT